VTLSGGKAPRDVLDCAQKMELRTIASYTRELRPMLPADTFAPARSRLLWLPVHITVIATLAALLALRVVPWYLWPLASIVIGCSLAGIVFLGHELLHGGVVRGRVAIRVLGWICMLPFTLSPQLWMAWHNRVHHNHCGQPGVDPDMYPTLHEYHSHRRARVMADYFCIGRRRLVGFFSLLFGFTGQSTQVLVRARTNGMLSPRLYRRALLESALGWAFWLGVALLVGFVPFLFVYIVPLVVANSIVMAFIMTNHNLSPLTPTNDPLVNSLSVTMPRFFEWLTLGFGYHVEHHMFPSVSTRAGRAIRAAIRAKWPHSYQSMPLRRALLQLYRTARVYLDNATLIDPPSGLTWPTLLPRDQIP
jgi:fatty acid desaturase